MTWPLVKVAAMAGLLGLVMTYAMIKFAISGWIIKPTEIAALRATLKERITAMDQNRAPRDNRIIALQSILYSYGFAGSPIILISAKQVAAIAPLINANFAATTTTDSERDALLAFKDRMIRQNFWPKASKFSSLL